MFPQVIETLGLFAKISVVGRLAGPVPNFNTATLFFRRIRIGGVALSTFTPAEAQSAWESSLNLLARTGDKTADRSRLPIRRASPRLRPPHGRPDGKGTHRDSKSTLQSRRLIGMSRKPPKTQNRKISPSPQIAVIASRFNQEIVDELLKRCVNRLLELGVKPAKISTHRVPAHSSCLSPRKSPPTPENSPESFA